MLILFLVLVVISLAISLGMTLWELHKYEQRDENTKLPPLTNATFDHRGIV